MNKARRCRASPTVDVQQHHANPEPFGPELPTPRSTPRTAVSPELPTDYHLDNTTRACWATYRQRWQPVGHVNRAGCARCAAPGGGCVKGV